MYNINCLLSHPPTTLFYKVSCIWVLGRENQVFCDWAGGREHHVLVLGVMSRNYQLLCVGSVGAHIRCCVLGWVGGNIMCFVMGCVKVSFTCRELGTVVGHISCHVLSYQFVQSYKFSKHLVHFVNWHSFDFANATFIADNMAVGSTQLYVGSTNKYMDVAIAKHILAKQTCWCWMLLSLKAIQYCGSERLE